MENQNNIPLTLEQVALNYANKEYLGPIGHARNIAFQAGAEWQKKQLWNLIRLIKEGLPVLGCEGFDELVEQINNELELLQD